MRTRSVFCLTVWICAVCSCAQSEKSTAPPADRIAPELRLLFPFSRAPLATIVTDSTDVYMAASDSVPGRSPGQIAQVELYFQLSDATEPTRIGGGAVPITLGDIPDTSLRARLGVPSGWSLYAKRWYTGLVPPPPAGMPIVSGTYARLFAAATDPAGNMGRTPDSLLVRVVNSSDFDPPSVSSFVVIPLSGRVGDEFVFDPSPTADRFDADDEIRVRWDFDLDAGDGWDLDWDAGLRANQPVRHAYAQPGSYLVCMEAHNSYLPDSISRCRREIPVRP